MREVPGIGSITGDFASSQANAAVGTDTCLAPRWHSAP